MKTVTYTCDNCEKEQEDLEGWIEIGSDDGRSLKIKNNLPDRKLISCGKHSDTHFCSAECLISNFVTKLKFDNVSLTNGDTKPI